MLREHTLEIRVGYHETDGQRRVHHANYLNYFERGRIELLRASGVSYRDFEDSGRMLVVSKMNVQYHRMAQFDELLTLVTTVLYARGARIGHQYRVYSNEQLLVQAESEIACVNVDGRPTRLPPEFQSF